MSHRRPDLESTWAEETPKQNFPFSLSGCATLSEILFEFMLFFDMHYKAELFPLVSILSNCRECLLCFKNGTFLVVSRRDFPTTWKLQHNRECTKSWTIREVQMISRIFQFPAKPLFSAILRELFSNTNRKLGCHKVLFFRLIRILSKLYLCRCFLGAFNLSRQSWKLHFDSVRFFICGNLCSSLFSYFRSFGENCMQETLHRPSKLNLWHRRQLLFSKENWADLNAAA